MKSSLFPGLLALLPAVLSAADVSGAWTGSIFGPIYVTLKQDGTQLSGSGGPSASEQMATFQNGRVEGDRVTFRVGPYAFDLKLEGDRLNGEVKSGDTTSKAFLRRVEKRPAGAPLPTFEVASVKVAPPPPIGGFNSSMHTSPGRLTCTNVTLKKLIARSYSVRDFQVTGPDWINTELYSVTASMPADTGSEDLLLMIQSLLAERFQLALRRESREMPVYELVVAKSGSRLAAVEFGKGSTNMSPGKLVAQGVPLRNFVDQLSRMLDRPVLDKTGLSGMFNFTLEWAPEGKGSDSSGELPVGASLFTAIQEQLGLKLESRRAPIEMLVVERAEKVPSGN